MPKSVHNFVCALFAYSGSAFPEQKGGESMAEKKNSIRDEISKIVKKKVSPEYAEALGITSSDRKRMSVMKAIAMAQVKKSLEGDLKAAMFIEEILDDSDGESAPPFDVVVKIVGENNGN